MRHRTFVTLLMVVNLTFRSPRDPHAVPDNESRTPV